MADKATRFAPKNIRQIGVTLPTDKIYIEDYVMTYIKQLSDVLSEEKRVLALVGWNSDEDGTVYSCVSGVVELIKDEGYCDYRDMLIGSNLEKLTKVKEDYFGDLDFVGLCVISRNEWIKCEEGLYSYFNEGMMGDLLLVRDGINEEQVFRYSNANFKKQRGYYIYYDRNEAMQNYMLCMKDGKSIEYGYSPSEIIDRNVDDKIRSFSIPKNAVYSAKGVSYKKIKINDDNRWRNKAKYVTASACVIAVLAVGVMKVDEFVKDTKQKADKLSSKTKEVVDNNSSKLEVETVSGELVMQDDLEEYIDSVNKNDSKEVNGDGMLDEQNKNGYFINGKDNKENGDTIIDESDKGNEYITHDEEKEKNKKYTKNAENKENEKYTQYNNGMEKGIVSDTKGIVKSGEGPENYKKATAKTSDLGSIGSNYYIVKKGDALVDISRKIYGTHKKVADIKRVNGIIDEDKIFIGQKLLMP